MASMNLAPSNNAQLDLDRTLNRMLLWLAPPERVLGDTARRLCRGASESADDGSGVNG
jgi:hypothetical protein